MQNDADIIIVGSGMGGATLAAALAPTGRRIVIVERGDWLPDTAEARDPAAIFARGHYRNALTWGAADGTQFDPGNYHYVGGNSKFYGAVLMRYRESDFAPKHHMGGTTTGWPFGYNTLAPYYDRAEAMYDVRGDANIDPTEPPRAAPLPHPPVPHEPEIADLARRLGAIGLTPSPLPLGVDLDRWLSGGQTPWDAFPDTNGGKRDAQSVGIARALEYDNVTLLTNTRVLSLMMHVDGHVMGVDLGLQDGTDTQLQAGIVVLAAGALETANILLNSGRRRGNGVANSSDQVGQNFMNHNASAVLALSTRRNRAVYQKTLQFNDWYDTGGPDGAPLGNVQLLGRVSAPILAAQTGLPMPLARLIASYAIDFYAMSEDIPNSGSFISSHDGDTVFHWSRSNMEAHEALLTKLKSTLRKAGFPLVLSRTFDRRTLSHQCGTARLGDDPATSVCNPYGQTHDHKNLYICDASLLPTSAAVNPSLTISALALRQADYIHEAAA